MGQSSSRMNVTYFCCSSVSVWLLNERRSLPSTSAQPGSRIFRSASHRSTPGVPPLRHAAWASTA